VTAPRFFETASAFRAWLEANADYRVELLVGFHKVDSALPSMSWSESVDEALCFGWIDGVRRGIDENAYSIRFTPRKSVSIWSAINIRKFEQLQAQGRMTPAGVAAFERRKASKSKIYAYEQESTAQLSSQELKTFRREKRAWSYFEDTPPSYKKVILHWITTAKRVDTRASRLATLITACASAQRLRK
jgi:uncharacterized protein YdeI (YjbR/CyaY-like superfamily)